MLGPGDAAAVDRVPDFCFTGYHKGGGLLVPTSELQRNGVYTCVGDIIRDFYAKLNIAALSDGHKAVRGEVVIRKAGGAKPVGRAALPA